MKSDLFDAIEHRRSVRRFSEKTVDREILEKMVHEALYAPNAGNRRQQRIIICTNREINERMGKIHTVLGRKYRNGGSAAFSEEDVEQAPSGFYHAPAVIYFFGPDQKTFLFAREDAAILIDHLYLISYAYGLGACMIGSVLDEFDTNYGIFLKKRWHIPEHYRICSFLVMGYPGGEYPDKPDIPSHAYPDIIFEQ